MSFIVAGAATVGAGVGIMRGNAAVKDAKNNLANARLQAELYDKKAGEVEAAATIEAAGVYSEAGKVKASRQSIQAARGISLNSQLVEAMDLNDLAAAKKASTTVLANAYLESSSLRTQGRLDVMSAESGVKAARKNRAFEIAGSAFQFGSMAYGKGG